MKSDDVAPSVPQPPDHPDYSSGIGATYRLSPQQKPYEAIEHKVALTQPPTELEKSRP